MACSARMRGIHTDPRPAPAPRNDGLPPLVRAHPGRPLKPVFIPLPYNDLRAVTSVAFRLVFG